MPNKLTFGNFVMRPEKDGKTWERSTLTNALLFAHASRLIYKEKEIVAGMAGRWGLQMESKHFIEGEKDMSCFVAKTDDIILV